MSVATSQRDFLRSKPTTLSSETTQEPTNIAMFDIAKVKNTRDISTTPDRVSFLQHVRLFVRRQHARLSQRFISPRKWTTAAWIRLTVFLVMLLTIVILFGVVRIQERLPAIAAYCRHHRVAGVFIYLAVFTLLGTLFVPASILSIGAGYLFSPIYFALVVVVAGVWLASSTSFFLGRFLLKGRLKRPLSSSSSTSSKQSRHWRVIHRAIRTEGWKLALLIRLCQVLPFPVGNYGLAATELPYHIFAITTIIGTFPGLAFNAYLGTLITDLTNIDETLSKHKRQYVLSVLISGCLVVWVLVMVTCIARRSWRDTIARNGSRRGSESAVSDVGTRNDDDRQCDGSASTKSIETVKTLGQGCDEVMAVTMNEETQASRDGLTRDASSMNFTAQDEETNMIRNRGDVEIDIDDDDDVIREPFTTMEKFLMIGTSILCTVGLAVGIPLVILHIPKYAE